ncbi:hypothetical protein CEXT_563921 [Caerostris extrusa]|uniref:Uncharacterized protein n=1 Tax=Caerostris extrusa TaxID=172846 RepID=A0AAV4VBP2_CAEEX|nr:hypothetical protein CEXT_563921 [Caerostris extrusa]
METAEEEWWRRMVLAATSDYSFREIAPGASNQMMINPELLDATCAEEASPFQNNLMQAMNVGNQTSAEQQARINCRRSETFN